MNDYRPSIPKKEHDALLAEVERLKSINSELTTKLKDILGRLIKEIDEIEMSEDTGISETLYSDIYDLHKML